MSVMDDLGLGEMFEGWQGYESVTRQSHLRIAGAFDDDGKPVVTMIDEVGAATGAIHRELWRASMEGGPIVMDEALTMLEGMGWSRDGDWYYDSGRGYDGSWFWFVDAPYVHTW